MSQAQINEPQQMQSAPIGQWSVVVNGLSKHFNVDADYAKTGINERNWGLGAQLDLARSTDAPNQQWLLNAGFYKDSSYGTAVYVGGGWLWEVWTNKEKAREKPPEVASPLIWQVQTGVQASAFYSPKYNDGKPFVALLPVMNVGV